MRVRGRATRRQGEKGARFLLRFVDLRLPAGRGGRRVDRGHVHLAGHRRSGNFLGIPGMAVVMCGCPLISAYLLLN